MSPGLRYKSPDVSAITIISVEAHAYLCAMLNYLQAQLTRLSGHTLGNKSQGGELIASRAELALPPAEALARLTTYFLSSFTSSEYYRLAGTDGDVQTNPIFNWAREIFQSAGSFHLKSVSLARHLYEVSVHPLIKPGDLLVCYFTDLQVAGTPTEAIGIFKSETKGSVLKLTPNPTGFFDLALESGISLEKLDKGCLIYNLDQADGYRLSIVDRSSKSAEAQYWKELFLRAVPVEDEFQATRQVLDIARHFVVDQVAEEFEVSKADQIDYLNKSIGYFKKNEAFNPKEFAKEVFEDPQVIRSFHKFENNFREQFQLDPLENFTISQEAVKRQARVFKSVLKLDKNFHIYIHGNRDLIERGVDPDGRKYYKIYYTQEA